jgi:hypothetical protein
LGLGRRKMSRLFQLLSGGVRKGYLEAETAVLFGDGNAWSCEKRQLVWPGAGTNSPGSTREGEGWVLDEFSMRIEAAGSGKLDRGSR